MYAIYKTEGLIVGRFDKKESSRLLYIFTKDFGLVLAQVQGVRDLKSKLRYSLQDFSHSYIDLVRGKSGWRVVSARSRENFSHDCADKEGVGTISAMARTIVLLKRLVKGEEKNELLFEELISSCTLLKKNIFSASDLFCCEIIIVMRMLDMLGYWGENDKLSPFLTGDIMENDLIGKMKKVKPLALRGINKALKETQL